MVEPGTYTVEETAKRLDVHPNTIRRVIDKGQAPFRVIRVGRAIRIPVVDIEHLLEAAS